MADLVLEEECGYINPQKLLLTYAGSGPNLQVGTAYTETGYTEDIELQDAYDESAAQAPTYPSPPPFPDGHTHQNHPYYVDAANTSYPSDANEILNEVVRQRNEGHSETTYTDYEPFNPLLGSLPAPSANEELELPYVRYGERIGRDSTSAGPGQPVARQNFGELNDNERPIASQEPVVTPQFVTLPSYNHQHSLGLQTAYEPRSHVPYSRLDLRHLRLDHTATVDSQSSTANSFVNSCGFDNASHGFSPPERPGPGTKPSSGISVPTTLQSTLSLPWSNEPPRSNHSATTPSHVEAEVVSPTTDAGGGSRQPSSAASARPFICNFIISPAKVCLKKFKLAAGLRKHKEIHDPDSETMTRHKCQFCRKGFRYPKDRNRHEMTAAHGGSGVLCPGCHERFSRQDNLDRHLPICPGPVGSSAAGTQ